MINLKHSIILGDYSVHYRDWTPEDGKPSDRGYPCLLYTSPSPRD